MNISEFRSQFPQYNYMSDTQLARSFYDKFYADRMTFAQFGRSIELPDTDMEQGAVSIFVDEYSKGVYRGFLNTAAGLVGTAEWLIPGEQESMIEAKSRIQAATERFNPTHEGAAAWSGRVLGEAIPFMATTLVGGYAGAGVAGLLGKSAALGAALGSGGVSFAVEGDAAYDAAKASGAAEHAAQAERIIVGSINAYLETLQIKRLMNFGGKAGKEGIKGFVRNVRNRAWNLARGNIQNFTGEILKLAVTEGLQEAAQEGVSIGVPAALRGEYPKNPDGTPDYYSILTQIGEAGLGGAFAGVVLGGGSAFIQSTPTIAAPTMKEAQQTVDLIKNSKLTETEKNILLRELDEQVHYARAEPSIYKPIPIKEEQYIWDRGDKDPEYHFIKGKETLENLPSIPEGYLRLFRGEHPTIQKDIYAPSEAWKRELGMQYKGQERDYGAGGWFTPDLGNALSYAATQEPGARVVYLDLPMNVANQYATRTPIMDVWTGISKTTEYFIPELRIQKFAPVELTETEKFQKKMDLVVDEIEKLRPAEKEEIARERGERFTEFRESLSQIKDPRQRVALSKSILAGRLKQEIAPLGEKFTSEEINTAYDTITTATLLTESDVLSAFEGMEKILFDGVIPMPSELKALQKANLLSKQATKSLLDNRTKWQKTMSAIRDLSFAPWALLTSFDVSAGGRQGWKVLFKDPKLWGKSVARGYRMLMSEDYFNYTELKRKTHPYYAEAIRRGVEETTIDSITRGEEMFASNMIQRVPGIRGSARAFIGTINEIRMGWYFKGREMMEGAGMTARQQRDLADIANDITGRGKLPKTLKKLQDIGLIFFAPRLTMGLIRTPADLLTKTGPGRKMLAGALVSFVGFTLATLYLLDRDDKDKIDVEWNPLSSDFLKIRHGKTRVDILGGYQPLIRTVIQLAYGKRKATETGRIYDVERTEIISRFLQSKLSPHAGLALDLWKGETFLGKKLKFTAPGVAEQIYNRAAPLFIQDVADAIKHQGLGMAGIIAPLAFHGLGVQTYPTTLTQDVRTLKDRLAVQHFAGTKWDELGSDAQKAIREYYPQIGLMEDEAKIDREDFDFIGKILQEADKTGRRIQGKLLKPIRAELDKYILDVGNIPRSMGSGWYLNDKRYTTYQQQLTIALNMYIQRLLVHPGYKRAKPEVQREILQEVISAVKKDIRMKLITQANIRDLQTREKMKEI